MENFFDLASEGISQLSRKVYLMLLSDSKGTNWTKDTYCDKFEWPALKKNTVVTEVIRVNPITTTRTTRRPFLVVISTLKPISRVGVVYTLSSTKKIKAHERQTMIQTIIDLTSVFTITTAMRLDGSKKLMPHHRMV